MDNDQIQEREDWYERLNLIVDGGQAPVRIDKFLADRLENTSRNRVQSAIKAGFVTVDGQEVKSNYKIKPGENILLILPKSPGESQVWAQKMDLDIRYEDDDILIIMKPPGLVVHPGVGNPDGTLVNGLAWYLGKDNLPVKEGNMVDRPGLVHRIDKNTSGLLVIAKNEDSMTHLAKQFYDHTVRREYLALVWGNFEEPFGTINAHVGRHPRHRLLMTAFPEGESGKDATTHYEVVEDLYYVSLVKCRLETGRTHQIRVHMQFLNHPVFNDNRYGGDRIVKGTVYTKYKQCVQNAFALIPRHALHAKSLGFIHPRTKKEMYFDSELPDDFQAVLEKWRNYVSDQKSKQNLY